MKYFTEKFMNKQRKMLLFSLAKAQANVGTKELPSWTDGKILKAEIQEDAMSRGSLTKRSKQQEARGFTKQLKSIFLKADLR